MTAIELHAHYAPANRDQALEIAQAFFAEEGDLPESIWYQLGLNQPDPAAMVAVWDALTALRAAHFQGLGQQVPAYDGVWV